jgi:hypothetical protein
MFCMVLYLLYDSKIYNDMKNKHLTTKLECSIIDYNYIYDNYNLTNYEIYQKMLKENKDIDWSYNIIFIEKYFENK